MASETLTPVASERTGLLAAGAAVVMWGAGNVIVKQIAMSGIAIAFNRLWLGVLVFGALQFVRGGRPSRRALWLAVPAGVAFTLDVSLFFVAIKHTSVADASIITALQPALVFVVAGRLFGEKVSWATVGWTVVAIAGAVGSVLASSAASGRTPGGDLLAVLSMIAWSAYFVLSKQCRQQLDTLEFQTSLTVVAALALTPVALLTSHDLVPRDGATFGWIVVMVIVPGGGHLLMNWAHNYAPITVASMLTLGIPVFAAIGAAIALGEPITAGQCLGMGVVIVALGAVLRHHSAAAPIALTTPDTA